jgi:hypothetical protein
MRKKIIFAVGSIISLVAVKALAGTLLATPGYTAPGCNWTNIGGGYYHPVSVSVMGLYCNGEGPALVKTTVSQPSGPATCSVSTGNTSLYPYSYSSSLTCNDYSVYKN